MFKSNKTFALQDDSLKKDSKGFSPFPSPIDFRPDDCIIDKMVQDEIDRGVPEWRRTRAFYVSCPCKKCNPYYL